MASKEAQMLKKLRGGGGVKTFTIIQDLLLVACQGWAHWHHLEHFPNVVLIVNQLKVPLVLSAIASHCVNFSGGILLFLEVVVLVLSIFSTSWLMIISNGRLFTYQYVEQMQRFFFPFFLFLVSDPKDGDQWWQFPSRYLEAQRSCLPAPG